MLLACWGLSLLLNRPTVSEAALHAAEARAAAAEKSAAAAEKSAEEKGQQADKAAAEIQELLKKFQVPPPTPAAEGKPSKSVVDFTIFRHNELGNLVVTTGWNYEKVTDPAPSDQWCHMHDRTVSDGLQLPIAVEGRALPFNPERAKRAGVTAADVQRALPLCEWFRGANPNIREGQGGAM